MELCTWWILSTLVRRLVFPLGVKIGLLNYLSKLFPNFQCPLLQNFKPNPCLSAQIFYGPTRFLEKANPIRTAHVTEPRWVTKPKAIMYRWNIKGEIALKLVWYKLCPRKELQTGCKYPEPLRFLFLEEASMLSNQRRLYPEYQLAVVLATDETWYPETCHILSHPCANSHY